MNIIIFINTSSRRCLWRTWSTCLVVPRRSQPSSMRALSSKSPRPRLPETPHRDSLTSPAWLSFASISVTYLLNCGQLTDPYSFPREDEGSPRQAILDKFCQDEVKQFRNCMNANNYDENKCLPSKAILDKCAAAAFKNVNANPELIF